MSRHDIIVIGASAGGVETIREVVRGLPPELPAAVFVVLHLPPEPRSVLPEILARDSRLPVSHPEDHEAIRQGRVYVAPTDHHMLLTEDTVRVVLGPHHNRHRPAIDPLFRSASRVHGPRVVGVILSGTLDDGVAGLQTIQRRGGLTVVQDPASALFSGMPTSALAAIRPDRVLAPADIGPALNEMANTPASDVAPPRDEILDIEISKYLGGKTNMERLGKPSVYACPECQGVLWEVEDGGVPQFHCRVGHSFTIETLAAELQNGLEASLWAAVRSLEEHASIRRRIAERLRRVSARMGERADRLADESEQHAANIRSLLNTPDFEGSSER